jgi:hypothetical protein
VSNPLVGGSLENEIARSYNSFAGADYRCMIGPFYFAELQAISYSVTREKAPVYTMGSADPRAYARNKRGIAGSFVWINFDRHALLNLFYQAAGKFVADSDEVRPQYQNGDVYGSQTAVFNSSLFRDVGPSVGATIDQLADAAVVTGIGSWTELATPWFSDQILPFDVTMGAANEYGAAAGLKILGVEILNEGTGMSIDDVVTETSTTFVARSIEPLQAVNSQFTTAMLGSTI